VAGIVAGLLVLAGFIGWELRQRQPLIDPRYFRRRPFAAGTLSLTLQFFCFFGFIFLFLQYLQLVRGESALTAAVQLLPMPLGLLPAARLAPHLVERLGIMRLCATGLVLISVGFWWLSGVETGTEYWKLAIALFPLGAGMGLAMTPATTAITDTLPAAEQGVASAMNDLARELGGALGIAVLGSVANSTYRSVLELPGAPAPVVDAARDSLAVATSLEAPAPDLAREAFVAGMEDAFRLAAVVIVVAAVVVVALLRRSAQSGTSTAARPAVEATDPQA
jgi:fucose permease